MKISLIVTTKNESRTISKLLTSIAKQTRIVHEIVIADAGSTDNTVAIIRSYQGKLPLRIIELESSANRAVGRNRAIDIASHEHILITDAGCRLDRLWVEKMAEGFLKAEVVAGFYRADAHTIFEKCVVPYVLIMPDRLNPKDFLPATRSMGITKKVWKQAGRFDERFKWNEDYVFARKLRSLQVPIQTVPTAIVYWQPRKTLTEFLTMIYNFAYGDAQSGMWRPKVGLIFTRYAIGLLLVSLIAIFPFYFYVVVMALIGYCLFAIKKNYRYVRHPLALLYLPLLQISSDMAVMWGTIVGILSSR